MVSNFSKYGKYCDLFSNYDPVMMLGRTNLYLIWLYIKAFVANLGENDKNTRHLN